MKKNNNNKKKQTLVEIYRTLPAASFPKKELKDRIAEVCDVSEATIRNWVEGKTVPGEPKHVFAISKLLGVPAEDLF